MFSHLMVGTNAMDKARAFYDSALGALGIGKSHPDAPVAAYRQEGAPAFIVVKPRDGGPATRGTGGPIGFKAKSAAEVDAFHAAGVANGGTCEGPPGVRENAPGKAYMAYLRDPDGNKICAAAPNPNAGA